jgi:hypothetical protein
MSAPAHLRQNTSTVTAPPTRYPASERAVWTADQIRALGTVTDIPTAAAIFGLSRSAAYDLARTGRFPVPVLRFGTRYRIPVPAILIALHLPGDPDLAPQAQTPAATT